MKTLRWREVNVAVCNLNATCPGDTTRQRAGGRKGKLQLSASVLETSEAFQSFKQLKRQLKDWSRKHPHRSSHRPVWQKSCLLPLSDRFVLFLCFWSFGCNLILRNTMACQFIPGRFLITSASRLCYLTTSWLSPSYFELILKWIACSLVSWWNYSDIIVLLLSLR